MTYQPLRQEMFTSKSLADWTVMVSFDFVAPATPGLKQRPVEFYQVSRSLRTNSIKFLTFLRFLRVWTFRD